MHSHGPRLFAGYLAALKRLAARDKYTGDEGRSTCMHFEHSRNAFIHFLKGKKTGWKPELRITNIRQRKSFGSVSGRSGVIYRSGRREQPAGPTPIAAAAATSSSPLSRSEAPRTRGNAPQCSLRPPPPPTNRRVSCWMALIQCCHDLRCDCVRPSCS